MGTGVSRYAVFRPINIWSAGGGGHGHHNPGAGGSSVGGSAVNINTGGFSIANNYGAGGGGNQSGTPTGAPNGGNSSQGAVIIRYKCQ